MTEQTIQHDYKLEGRETAPGVIEFVKVPLKVQKPAVEPVRASEPKSDYVPLLALSDRKRARLALKAWAYDWKNFGRTDFYSRFKEQLQDELDSRELQALHLVQELHCAKHEALLASIRMN